MTTHTVEIIFTDGEIEIREYRNLKDAERCIRDYSDLEECAHVHFI